MLDNSYGKESNIFSPKQPSGSDGYSSSIKDNVEKAITPKLVKDFFNEINSENGVRIQLPNFTAQVVYPESQNQRPLDLNSQTLNLQGSKPSGKPFSTLDAPLLSAQQSDQKETKQQQIDSEVACEQSREPIINAVREGQIPVLISLLEKPNQETTVQLSTDHASIELSAELKFTPSNWSNPQLVWIDMTDITPEEMNTTLKIIISKAEGDAATPQLDTLNIILPIPKECTSNECGTCSEESRKVSDAAPNLDLELSTITEDKSAFFLLLRSSLSPFLVLANMVLQSIRKLQSGKDAPTPESVQLSRQSLETEQLHSINFEGVSLSEANGFANTSPPAHEAFELKANDAAFNSMQLGMPFEIF